MLTPDERLDANSHERAVGSRVSGHFDHTASNITGPYPSRPGAYEERKSSEDQGSADSNEVLVLGYSIDEQTGEWIYEDSSE